MLASSRRERFDGGNKMWRDEVPGAAVDALEEMDLASGYNREGGASWYLHALAASTEAQVRTAMRAALGCE